MWLVLERILSLSTSEMTALSFLCLRHIVVFKLGKGNNSNLLFIITISSISVKPRCLSIVDLLLELAGATLANRRDFRRGAKNRTRRPVQMNVTKLQNQTTYLRRRSNKLPIGGVYGWGL